MVKRRTLSAVVLAACACMDWAVMVVGDGAQGNGMQGASNTTQQKPLAIATCTAMQVTMNALPHSLPHLLPSTLSWPMMRMAGQHEVCLID
jgi:hypothetical protein